MIVTPKCVIKNIGNQICSTLHLLVPRLFSLATLSLYFLFDISRNSSLLPTNSINFSSIFEEKDGTLCKQMLDVLWRRRKTVCTVGIEQEQRGPEPFRRVIHSRPATET